MTHCVLLLLALAAPVHHEGDKAPATDGKGEWTWTEAEGGYWWRYKRANTEAETPIQALNRRRAWRGLRPCREDALLSQSAANCAAYRAARHMAGHTSNDFAFLVHGARSNEAGCAAWPPSMGWGSCCADDPGISVVGVGWCMGSDGLRYMHLFVGR